MRADRSGKHVDGAQHHHRDVGDQNREREAHQERDQRPPGQRRPTLDQCHTEAGERTEFGADDHCADDQDDRIGDDPDRRDHRRKHHEREKAPGENGALARAGLDLLPDDRVRGGARSRALGLLGAARDGRVDLDRDDAAAVLESELAQPLDHRARVLARDVGEHDVTHGVAGGAREVDDAVGRPERVQESQHPVAQVRRDDETQVDHGSSLTGAPDLPWKSTTF